MSTIKVGLMGGGGIVDAHIRGYRAYADAIKTKLPGGWLDKQKLLV